MKKITKQYLAVFIGLLLGQSIPFFIIPTPTWMIVDKILFGVGFGVGFAGLFNFLVWKYSK